MIFLDRNVPRSVAKALQQVRNDVKWLEDLGLPADTPDVSWLQMAGEQAWLVITRDQHIRRRPYERRVIEQAGVGAFVSAQNQPPNRWEWLQIVVCLLNTMERLFASTPRPFIYGIYQNRSFRRLL